MPDNSSTDLPASTSTTGWVGASSRTYGTITTHDDADWYRTYLVAGVSYTLTLDADNLDPTLVLRDANGAAITSNTGEANYSRAFITYTPGTSGYYYLDAHASGNTKAMGDYTLEVKTTRSDDYTATNQSTSTLTLGQAGAGNVELAGDADWHRVVLSAGQTYAIDLGGALADNGQIRVMSEGGHTQFVLANGHATFTPRLDGIYFVEVSADPRQPVTGGYSVTVTPQPSVSVANATLLEGNDGSTLMSFVITLPSAATSAVTVQVDTADETAVAGKDYTALHTSITIAAGATTATVTVPVLGNTQFTPNRTFALTATVGGDTTKHTARGTIVDDDAPASLNLPVDPLLGNQWYLFTTRTEQAWALATGQGVKVAVFDAGIDASVPDLAPNLNQALSIDGLTLKPGGQPVHVYDFHGTMVAGVIAAARNGTGLVGVAYGAQLVSIYQGFDADTLATLSNGFFYARNVDVMNNSWGYDSAFLDDAYSSFFAPIFKVMQDTVTLGRGGLGTIIVQSAGNSGDVGDDTNLHNFGNNRYTITVGATDSYGHAASYSTPGASVLVAAPGGGGNEDGNSIFTTDRPGAAGLFNGDTAYLDGTSFAAPVVSGIVALMLQANPKLGFRDVQQILAYTARQVDVGQGTWDTNGAHDWNGGGLHYNAGAQLVGFGQVDALGAVRLAASWDGTPQTVANTYEVDISRYPTLAIPDNNTTGISDSITVTDAMTVERVEVYVIITHPFIGDLKLVLTSPTGTQSVLMANPDKSSASPNGSAISGVFYGFSTVLDWGENAQGTWTLKVVDNQAGDVGTLSAWELDIVGRAASNSHTFVYTDEYPALLAANAARGTLSDPGGAQDTLNAAALSNDSRIDLSGASTSLLNGAPLTIAAGTLIARAISGAGNDTLIASNRGSTLRGMGGNDTLVGGSGTDMAVYGGSLKDYSLSISGSSATLAATITDSRSSALDGSDRLTGIERLQFADQHLALDMGAAQAGGKAVLMMAAALGTGFTGNKSLASAFVGYFDGGATLLDGASLLVSIGLLPALAGGADNASFVKLIYGNVTGSAPDAATLAALVAPLDAHTSTQAQWLADVATSSANQAHVGLVGLAQHGWAYL